MKSYKILFFFIAGSQFWHFLSWNVHL